MSLSYVGTQLTIYVGSAILIAGILGNGINIFIFSSVRTYRNTPSTFYFLVGSIHNLLYLAINLTFRIVSVGSGFDLTRTSLAWCRARSFFLSTISVISFTCSCLATIDQFLATSQSAHLRRYSKIELAYRIVLVAMVVWYLQGIPWILYQNISPISNTCVRTDAIYAIYVSVYLLLVLCVIPVVVMIGFGFLTYRNIRLTIALAELRADRQLAKMTLIQVVLVIISIIPYGINNAYGLITTGMTKDANRILIESFVSTIVSLITYLYYMGSFYMFLISSSRFRHAKFVNDNYWKDAYDVYYMDKRLDGVRASSFELLKDGYFKDASDVYYMRNKIEGARASAFQLIDKGYSKDASDVYYMGKKINDARASSFQFIDNGYAEDYRNATCVNQQ
ncbi:unnamed protein product [Adineta steineri]|uniref:G-protein coupled receptors family 1 profile domain-containing protein n=1 Tax=Adineta steineri TaxID=433720 RepID=A0A814WEG5_9BILA|nr:unnamed protein product [Adineta steineri]CAF1201275.1 unnamed protein product [Adineta steineri]